MRDAFVTPQVAGWSLFEVLGADHRPEFVALRPPPPAAPAPTPPPRAFYAVREGGAVDTRLLPPHTFLLSAEVGEEDGGAPPAEVRARSVASDSDGAAER